MSEEPEPNEPPRGKPLGIKQQNYAKFAASGGVLDPKRPIKTPYDADIHLGWLALVFVGFAILYFATASHYGEIISKKNI
jgi:hypothetical protein